MLAQRQVYALLSSRDAKVEKMLFYKGLSETTVAAISLYSPWALTELARHQRTDPPKRVRAVLSIDTVCLLLVQAIGPILGWRGSGRCDQGDSIEQSESYKG